MKSVLILFAKGFPYRHYEPFLENELAVYRNYFNKVLIITDGLPGEIPTRRVDDSFVEVISDYSVNKNIMEILRAIPLMLSDCRFYKEIREQFEQKTLTLRRLREIIGISLCGNSKASKARKWLRQHPDYQCNVLYSYWMHIPAYAALRMNHWLKNRCFTVSRAHGFDLYLERSKTNYIPFHKYMYRELSEIASISTQGKLYLENHYGASNKVSVHRLGAADHNCYNPPPPRDPMNIVTCSRTIPLKRLHRLVDSLALLPYHRIHWTHIGDGELQEDLKQYSQRLLPSNITVTFKGRCTNAQVYDIYRQEHFHVFVNISETEGVPVSIMEAMSFGIPTIATDVGGTAELVEHGGNGYLLPKDFSDQELAAQLAALGKMPEEAYLSLRTAARAKFKHHYCAEDNYTAFAKILRSHADKRNEV